MAKGDMMRQCNEGDATGATHNKGGEREESQ